MSAHYSISRNSAHLSFSSLSPRDRARFPPHKQIPFDALYYHIGDTAPYVATLPLDERGYRIPARFDVDQC